MLRTYSIFVYGTLQYPEVAAAVTGHRLVGVTAYLEDYARYQVRRAPYPGIAPADGHRVTGLLYRHVDGDSLARIDAFEGRIYRRQRVAVYCTETAAYETAQAYVVRPRYRTRLAPHDWDTADFERRWLAVYAGSG